MAALEDQPGLKPSLKSPLLRFQDYFLRLISHPRIPEASLLFIFSVFIGAVTGLVSFLFLKFLKYTQNLFYGQANGGLPSFESYWLILLPALGGLAAGLLIYYLSPETKGAGVSEVMTAILNRGSRIRARVPWVKFVASSLTIGSGGSLGVFAPMVQIGAGLGSSVGQFLRVSEQRLHTFLACGAAAGIAATFNAPIGGAVFALEIFFGQFTPVFSLVLFSSVTATLISRSLLGNFPSFAAPPHELINYWELPLYLILGIFAGFLAILYTLSLHRFERLFGRLTLPAWLKPALGGCWWD